MNIRSKFLSIQIIMALFIVVSMVFFHRLADRLEGDFDAMEYQTVPVMHALQRIHVAGLNIYASINRILLLRQLGVDPHNMGKLTENSDSESYDLKHEVDEAYESIALIQKQIEHYQTLVNQFFPDEVSLQREVVQIGNTLVEQSLTILSMEAEGKPALWHRKHEMDLEVTKHKLDKLVKEAMKHELGEVSEHHENLEAQIESIEHRSIYVGLLLLGFGLLLSLYASRSIVKPIQILSTIVLNPDKNRSYLTKNVRRSDEIGELSRAFERMHREQDSINKALQNQLTFIKVLMDAIPTPIYFKDIEGRYQGCNKAFEKFIGKTQDELVGKTVSDIAPGKLAEEYHQADRELIDNPGVQVYESSVVRQDGVCRNVVFHQASYQDQGGQLKGLVGAILDITNQKEMETALRRATKRAEEASRAKSLFLAHMSHEIRTPLNAILGMAEMLGEVEMDDEYRDYLTTLQKAGETLLALITEVLDLSKIEAGQLVLADEVLDLRLLVERTADIQQPFTREKGLDLTLNFDAQLPRLVRGDPDRLRQVLLNLLNNAIKFTDSGTVSIAVKPDASGEQVMFLITDTGIGMTPEQQARIFTPFTQADATTTRRYGGTGLGLTICKSLIESMDGEIELKSREGEGSQFSVIVPLPAVHELQQQLGDDALTEPVERVALEEDGPKRVLNILLVDDAPENRKLIRAFLKKGPYRIETAENGAVAVEKFQSQPFDLLLMDMLMPVMDGYEATARIRQWEQEGGRQAVPIIALTAQALKEDLEKAIDAGCNRLLTKPVRKARLIEVIQQVTG